MKLTNQSIVSIAGDLVQESTLKPSKQQEWIDIAGITQRPAQLTNSLYFATHLDGTDGWHNPVDRRDAAAQVGKNKGWDLAIEPGTLVGASDHLVVSSLTELSSRLYEEVRRNTNPYIVGVTGSVGKTTTVAFLEHLLATAGYPVTRFWSKRLTPLLVQCHYINRVDAGTRFVVMEYSAYGHSHVSDLAGTLPPNIAYLTNIYPTHINPGMFRDEHDILQSKLKIRPASSTGHINQAVLHNLGVKTPDGWTPFSVDTELVAHNPSLPPTLRTAEMHTVGRQLASEIGIPEHTFEQAFKTFTPQERRILSVRYGDHSIFFDGEATYGSRQWSWFETIDGSIPTLFVEDINFGDEDPLGYINLLEKIFSSDSTFVLDTPENRMKLPVTARFVNTDEFKTRLKQGSTGYCVYHKAMSTRDPNFDPETYLKNKW